MQTPFTFDEFAGFIDELRRKGFPIGIDHYIAARQMLDTPVARQRLERNPASLVTLLAPILCSNAQTQEEFYLEYLQWLDRHDRSSKPADEAGQRRNAIVGFAREPRYRHMRRLLWLAAFVGAGFLFFEDMLFPPPIDTARMQTLTRSTYSAAERAARQRFSIAFPNGMEEGGVGAEQKSDAARPSGDTSGTGAVGSSAIDTVMVTVTASVEPGFYRRHYRALKLGAAILPLVAFVVWVIGISHRIRSLERKRASSIPMFTSIAFSRDPDGMFGDPELRRNLQSLRRHRAARGMDLDLAGTVEATVRNGGWFSPIHAPRHVMPEYLVLIDRAGALDQQAFYFDRMIDELVAEGAYVDRYYFRGNPRNSVRRDDPDTTLSLAELAMLHPDHRLLILGDGRGLFNPLDGMPYHWLDLFSAWELRVLLTPESSDDLKPRHAALLDAGFITLPASVDGLAELAGILVSGATEIDEWESRQFPPMLAEDHDRWLSRTYPGSETVEDLRMQLLDYLGIKGYFWFAACALFPMMKWELTLHLGRRLLTTEQMEELLPSLVRLPWMRHGAIPDWLRIAMVATLPEEQLRRMRAVVDELLDESARRPGEIELRMARDETTDDQRDPYDYVFLCFMQGRRPKQTVIGIPKSMRRLIDRDDPNRIELRPILQFSLAAICLLVAAALLLYPPENPPLPSIAATPSGGIPNGVYTLRLTARDAPEDYFDGAELAVLHGRRLLISDLEAGNLEATATIVVPDGEVARKQIKYDRGREVVTLGIWRKGEMIGTFPFVVRK